MFFGVEKSNLKKSVIGPGGLELIVLNPFLDYLCNFGFKNIGLTPGIPKGCFQHPQDAVNTLIAFRLKNPLKRGVALILRNYYDQYFALFI